MGNITKIFEFFRGKRYVGVERHGKLIPKVESVSAMGSIFLWIVGKYAFEACGSMLLSKSVESVDTGLYVTVFTATFIALRRGSGPGANFTSTLPLTTPGGCFWAFAAVTDPPGQQIITATTASNRRKFVIENFV